MIQNGPSVAGAGSLVVPREAHHEQPVANPQVVSARHGVQTPCENSSSLMGLERPTTAAPLRPELQSARGLTSCERSCSSSALLERPAVAGVVGNSSMTGVFTTLRPELLLAREGRPKSFDRSYSSSCLVDKPIAKGGTRLPARCLEPPKSSRQGRTATTLTRSTSSSSLERPPGGRSSLHAEQLVGGGLPPSQRSCSSSCPLQLPAAVVGSMPQPAATMTSRHDVPSAWPRRPSSCDRSRSPSSLLERPAAGAGTRVAARRLEQPSTAGQLGKATASTSCLERPPTNGSLFIKHVVGGCFLEGLATSPVERSESRPRLQAQICNPTRSCSPPHPRAAPVHQTSLAPPAERAPSPKAIKRNSSFPWLDAAPAAHHSASYSRLEVLVPRTNDRSARAPRAELPSMARPAGGAPPPAVRSTRVLSLRRD